MKNKKSFIFYIVTILFVVCAVYFGIWLSPWPEYEMPVMPFVFRGATNDIYVFDSKGNIFLIEASSGKTYAFDWVEDTIACLERESSADWLQVVGKTDVTELQTQYNYFRKMMAHPNYRVYSNDKELPQMYQSETTMACWYGFTEGNEAKDIYYEGGYLHYKTTDKRAYWIVDWISSVVNAE